MTIPVYHLTGWFATNWKIFIVQIKHKTQNIVPEIEHKTACELKLGKFDIK